MVLEGSQGRQALEVSEEDVHFQKVIIKKDNIVESSRGKPSQTN